MVETFADYLRVDPTVHGLVNRNSRRVQLWTGAAWTEGPLDFGDADHLLFSDIPNDRMGRFVSAPPGRTTASTA